MKIHERITKDCTWKCKCFYCNEFIYMDEKLIELYKRSYKGTVRINICRNCLLKIMIELNFSDEEIGIRKKEILMGNL